MRLALAAGRLSWTRPRAGLCHCAQVVRAGVCRVWWVPESQRQGLRRRLRGERPRSGEWGLRSLLPDAACGRLRPGFPVPSSPDGSRPVRWYQVGPPPLWPGDVRLDTTGPISLAAPADATGNPGQPHLWVDGAPDRSTGPAGVWHPGRCHAHTRRCPGSLVAVGGPCQSDRTGGAKSHAAPPQQRRSDLAPPGRADSVHGDDSDEGTGTKATTTRTAADAGCWDPSEPRPLAAQAPPKAPLNTNTTARQHHTRHHPSRRAVVPTTTGGRQRNVRG